MVIEMGTSWIRRHKNELESATRIANDRRQYEEWAKQFKTRGRWDERKVKQWMEARTTGQDINTEEE